MKTSHINKKLTLNKMTVAVLTNPQTVKGGSGNEKNSQKTVRTTTITDVNKRS